MGSHGVPQSCSKGEFFTELGLDKASGEDADLYSEMKTEATRGYNRHLARTANLKPEFEGEAAPWSYNQFTESAINHTVTKIYNAACVETKSKYDSGGQIPDNWVIKWMLYHVCRYRDERNKKNKPKKGDSRGSQPGRDSPPPPPSAGAPGSAGAPSSPSRGRMYDQVRDKLMVM